MSNKPNTPTPWAIGVGKFGRPTLTTADAPITQAIGGRKLIATFERGRDAEATLRAVNSHADLVAALKSAEGALGIARNVMGVHELRDSRWDTARTIAEKTINEIRIALENLR